jgi:hypothetical protein
LQIEEIWCTCDGNPTWLQEEVAWRRSYVGTPAEKSIELNVNFFSIYGIQYAA